MSKGIFGNLEKFRQVSRFSGSMNALVPFNFFLGTLAAGLIENKNRSQKIERDPRTHRKFLKIFRDKENLKILLRVLETKCNPFENLQD